MNTELEKSIKFYNDFVKGKCFSDEKLQNTLSDCLFRYIHLWEVLKDKKIIKVIDAIKKFNKSRNCKNRHKEIMKLLILPTVNETNRLLLIKSVYFEDEYELL